MRFTALKLTACLHDFSYGELVACYDNLSFVLDAASGCCNQPRCGNGDNDLNKAGELLDDLGAIVSDLKRAVVEELQRRTPDNQSDQNIRDYVLLRDIIFENDKLEDDLAEAFKAIGRKVVVS